MVVERELKGLLSLRLSSSLATLTALQLVGGSTAQRLSGSGLALRAAQIVDRLQRSQDRLGSLRNWIQGGRRA